LAATGSASSLAAGNVGGHTHPPNS
jgi:hypothetical protein